ncbi:MAG: hypothetical protein ACLR0U_21190 [Enterocloster clostridioformis]
MNKQGLTHNWFFGMRYDFEFVLGDYTGPMDYYFREMMISGCMWTVIW